MLECLKFICGSALFLCEYLAIRTAACCPPGVIQALCCWTGVRCANLYHSISDSCHVGVERARAGGEHFIEDVKNFCCPPDQQAIELTGDRVDHHDAV